jgi:pimeloyl-ACP methyl ester carboxylesterase
MFATVNGARLFFDVVGEKLRIDGAALKERPTLVCLHGGPGGDHQSLRPDFDRFADRAQIIYLDQRGGGRSDRGAPDTWTLDQWGDDVAALCDALGIAKPIVLGVSGGAMVTLSYLSRHPGHAGGAILVNACARLDQKQVIARFAELGGAEAGEAARNMYTRGEMKDVPPFFQHCLPLYSRLPQAQQPAPRGTFNFAISRHFFSGGGAAGPEAFRFDFRGKLGAVTCPVLALVGAHDPITQLRWGREAFEALPAGIGEYLLFEASSHTLSSDEPAKFYAAVDGFIDRVAR